MAHHHQNISRESFEMNFECVVDEQRGKKWLCNATNSIISLIGVAKTQHLKNAIEPFERKSKEANDR